jgi:hypothetical protein
VATFDQTSGQYSLETDNITGVPQGTYVFDIVASLGSSSFTTTYTVEFKNPCTVIPINVRSPTPFVDHTQYIGNAMYSQSWIIDDVATPLSGVNCGDMSVEFFYKQGGQLDQTIFNINYDHSPYKFEVMKIDDTSKEDTYEITYQVSYADYADTTVASQDSFEIEIVDLCADMVSISPSTLVDQEYTLTGPAKNYKIDAFTTDPLNCAIVYSFDASDEKVLDAVQFNNDQAARRFTFSKTSDVSLSGPIFQEYTITVFATAGTGSVVNTQATFKLTVSNPCIDEAYFAINAFQDPVTAQIEYTLY